MSSRCCGFEKWERYANFFLKFDSYTVQFTFKVWKKIIRQNEIYMANVQLCQSSRGPIFF